MNEIVEVTETKTEEIVEENTATPEENLSGKRNPNEQAEVKVSMSFLLMERESTVKSCNEKSANTWGQKLTPGLELTMSDAAL